ncbi:MAG: TlpA family protein disulfide reductase [Calditrichaeota bacterium]|nr:TlpA family protein disulfide reductase [Calditrichota bacterium]MCB9365757.1 TlpA family protein disulfide reductase [Calditrichota bacterium]
MKSLLLLLMLASVILTRAENAPEFKVVTDQGEVSLESLAGKVVYLDFWASWCKPCKDSFPWMNELASEFADSGLVVLAVNLDRDSEKVAQFLEKNPPTFTVGYDPEGIVAKACGVQSMPSTYLIGKHGELLMTHLGFREKDKNDLRTSVEQALMSR